MKVFERDQLLPLCFLDGDLFTAALDDESGTCCEQFIRPLLGKPGLTVLEVLYKNGGKHMGPRPWLEVLASDPAGELCSVRIQKHTRDLTPAALAAADAVSRMSGRGLKRGVRHSYRLILLEQDLAGLGLPLYQARTSLEAEPAAGSETALYVNGTYCADDEIGRVLADFRSPDPAEMHNSVFAERMRFLKNTQEGRLLLSKAIDILVQERVESLKEDWERECSERIEAAETARQNAESALQGAAMVLQRASQARQTEVENIARRLLSMGLSAADTAGAVELTEEEVEAFRGTPTG